MEDAFLSSGEDDDDEAILKAVNDGDWREETNPLVDRADRRKNAVDVFNTDNLAAVRRNNGREIIILLCRRSLSFVVRAPSSRRYKPTLIF